MTRGVDAVLAPLAEVQSMHDAAAAALRDRQVLRSAQPRGLPIVVCLWKRRHRLPAILRTVAEQSAPCDLYLWNNDAAAADEIARQVLDATDAPARVVLATCPVNVGGYGRFFWARELAPTHPYVLFLDDDQILDRDTAATFLAEAAPGVVRSAWGFRFTQRRRYWQRQPAAAGAPAKYCGTGGMLLDASAFLDERLFRCPVRYWFCEDIWLSWFASTALRWRLYKTAAEVGWLLDEVAQYPELHKRKNELFRLLNGRGAWIDPT